jgi:hypothetical protein
VCGIVQDSQPLRDSSGMKGNGQQSAPDESWFCQRLDGDNRRNPALRRWRISVEIATA